MWSDKTRLRFCQLRQETVTVQGLFSTQQISESDELLFDPYNNTAPLFWSTGEFKTVQDLDTKLDSVEFPQALHRVTTPNCLQT